MKLAIRLTLDGLVRALKLRAHAMAEDGEARYRAGRPGDARGDRASGRTRRTTRRGDEGHDRSGR